jgi:23S rRNA-/tRNA-specific pseudouridylate synthase
VSGGEPAAREDASAGFAIAYEDAHVLVVDKSAGVVVHPARGHREGTLSQLLARTAAGGGVGGDPDRPGIVHRLDRDTSGLLIVARSSARSSAGRSSANTSRSCTVARRRARARSTRRSVAMRACARA